MTPFPVAVERHAMLADVVVHGNRAQAAELYGGVTGLLTTPTRLSAAAAETTPIEYLALVLSDEVAAAFATSCLVRAFQLAGYQPATDDAAREAARLGWAAFRQLADQAGYLEHGYRCDKSAAWRTLEDVTAQQVDPVWLRRVLELAGRLYTSLNRLQASYCRMPEEIHGVELGGMFHDLLPDEYALLCTDETELELFHRLLERRTQQFERRGVDSQSRGPLVILRDESGSMKTPPTRNEFAVAATIALTQLAWKQGRHVAVVHFSTAAVTDHLSPGDLKGLVRAQGRFLSGGTDIARALRQGAEAVRVLAREGHVGADLVLISDGTVEPEDHPLIEHAVTKLTQAGIRLLSVPVESHFAGALREQAAAYLPLSGRDLTRPDAVSELRRAFA